jgi:S-adenosylmethionine:tRNA-ribosyltransferase-isomerase (queuine synthetase)
MLSIILMTEMFYLNNTKVFQRVCMETKKTGARIEVFFTENLTQNKDFGTF